MQQVEKELRETLELKNPGLGRNNYSVRAGAGGGKTTMLSFRICEQILEGTPIEEFVTITYTNAAAAELREKITTRLRKTIEEGISDPVRLNNAQKALNNIELMQISTIHSFLLKILREYAFESGIVLDARMLEGEEENARKLNFFNEWYRNNYKDFKAFSDDWNIEIKSTGKKRDFTRDVFRNMFMSIANIREKIEFNTGDNTQNIENVAQRYVNEMMRGLANYESKVITVINNVTIEPKDVNAKVVDLITVINTINKSLSSLTKYSDSALVLSDALKEVYKIQEAGKSIYNQRKAALKGQLGYYYPFPQIEYDWNFRKVYELMAPSQKASKVVEYAIKMQEEYRKKTDADTKELSNDDILYRAEKLLNDHSEIRDNLRKKYSKLYVDEFQDTTGLQTRIIKMLAQKPGTEPDSDALAPDKLLVVGDPKQSIYRFTGAEISVYEGFDALLDKAPDDNSMSVTLDTNFRSNKAIVDWVNDSFSRLMANQKSGYKPMETDWTVSDPKAISGVFGYDCPDKYNREADVDAVAELVKKLVEGECYLEEPDRKKDGTFGTPKLRRINYSDIMIICKTTTHMSDFVKKFAELGIPVNVQGKFSINNDMVLRNFLLLVEYFAGYKNKKSRVAAAQVLGTKDATSLGDDLKKYEELLRNMRRYFRIRQYDAAAIVRYLLAHKELFLPNDVEQKKERVRTYRIRLNQMVETCLMNNTGDLYEFAKLMEQYIESEVKREIPLESNENALRLMNVHQSKGLTGQIVIIADRSGMEECRFSSFKSAGSYYPTAEYKYSEYGQSKTVSLPAYGYDTDILKKAYKEETEEAIRLQYVAATRAAHALIIMPVISKADAWFSDKAYGYDQLPTINEKLSGLTASAATASSGAVSASRTLKLADLEANKVALGQDYSEQLSVKSVFSVTPSGMEASGVTGYSVGNPGYVAEERPGGNIFGTVMHRVYELLIYNYSSIISESGEAREKKVTRIINQAVLEQSENLHKKDNPDEFVAYLKPIILKYISHVFEPIMASAKKNGSEPEIYTEYSFSFYVDDAEKDAFMEKYGKYMKHVPSSFDRIWVNGQADLVVRQADGSIKVYDYKSDARNNKDYEAFKESCAKKYEGQLALYRYAIGKTFDEDPESVQTELVDLYRGEGEDL